MPLPGTQVTIAFDAGSFAGEAGCNRYNGVYEVHGDQIAIELGATTRRACPEPIMSQERAYLTALSQAATFRKTVDGLELLDVGGRVLLAYAPAARTAPAATAIPAEPAAQLAGPVWQWLETKGGDGSLLAIQTPERYTVQFMPDGTLAVQADCNSGSGVYEAEGSRLHIDINTLTDMVCPEGSLSAKFVASLNVAGTYVLADGFLYINMQMDSGDMKFAPAAGE